MLRVSIKVRGLLSQLRDNLDHQDKVDRSVLRMRALDKPACVEVLTDRKVILYSEMGVIISQLKREGLTEDTLKTLIYGE